MPKFCTNCGQVLNDVDKFCHACGMRQATIKSLNQATIKPPNQAAVKSSNVETMAERHSTSLYFTDINKISKILSKELVKAQVAIYIISFGLIGLLFCLFLKADTKGIVILMSYTYFSALVALISAVAIGLSFPIVDFHDMVRLQKNLAMSMETALDALSSMGKIIDTPMHGNRHIITARCRSGTLNMNIAIICVKFVEIDNIRTDLYISAYAKEGIISQRTAEKAVERLKERIIW